MSPRNFELYNKRSVSVYDRNKKNEYYNICQFLNKWAKLIFTDPDLGDPENIIVFFDFGDYGAGGCKPKNLSRIVWTGNQKVAAMRAVADPKEDYENKSSKDVKLVEYDILDNAKMLWGDDGFPISVSAVYTRQWWVTVTVNRICSVREQDGTFVQASMPRTTEECERALEKALSQSDCFRRFGS